MFRRQLYKQEHHSDLPYGIQRSLADLTLLTLISIEITSAKVEVAL